MGIFANIEHGIGSAWHSVTNSASHVWRAVNQHVIHPVERVVSSGAHEVVGFAGDVGRFIREVPRAGTSLVRDVEHTGHAVATGAETFGKDLPWLVGGLGALFVLTRK